MMKENKEHVCWHIKQARLKPFTAPVVVNIVWYERTHMRDPDGITGYAVKVVMDALVDMKVLPGDSQKYVKEINNKIEVDKQNPHILIEINISDSNIIHE
jgi:hypothetical protein